MLELATRVLFDSSKLKDLLSNYTYKGCLASKMKESFNKKIDNRSTIKIRRLHADISGIQVPSAKGYRYWLLMIDDSTRISWIRLLKSKSAKDVLP